MGIETAIALGALAVSAAGTGAAIKGGKDARKDAKKQNKANARESAINNLIRVAQGSAPGAPPQFQPLPGDNTGAALQGLASAISGTGTTLQGNSNNKLNQEFKQAQIDALAAEAALNKAFGASLQNGTTTATPTPQPTPTPSAPESSRFDFSLPDILRRFGRNVSPQGQ